MHGVLKFSLRSFWLWSIPFVLRIQYPYQCLLKDKLRCIIVELQGLKVDNFPYIYFNFGRDRPPTKMATETVKGSIRRNSPLAGTRIVTSVSKIIFTPTEFNTSLKCCSRNYIFKHISIAERIETFSIIINIL